MYNESSIVISPVANGWIITLPQKPEVQEQNPLGLPFKMDQLGDFFRTLKQALEEDPGDVSAIIRNAEELLQKAVKEDKEPHITPERQPNVHVFPTFKETLSFLEFTIVPED